MTPSGKPEPMPGGGPEPTPVIVSLEDFAFDDDGDTLEEVTLQVLELAVAGSSTCSGDVCMVAKPISNPEEPIPHPYDVCKPIPGPSGLPNPFDVCKPVPQPGSTGFLEERNSITPNTLDLPPFVADIGDNNGDKVINNTDLLEAGGALSLYLEFCAPSPPALGASWQAAPPPLVLHNEQALNLYIDVTQWPPSPGTSWTKQGSGVVPLLDANSQPTGYGIAAFNVSFVLPPGAVGGTAGLIDGADTDVGASFRRKDAPTRRRRQRRVAVVRAGHAAAGPRRRLRLAPRHARVTATPAGNRDTAPNNP